MLYVAVRQPLLLFSTVELLWTMDYGQVPSQLQKSQTILLKQLFTKCFYRIKPLTYSFIHSDACYVA